MISLCIIVKNEEDNLRNCIINVKQFVNEIIVVDTGSTDNTKAIAFEFTDKVYDFKWCDDFAAARNFSISKANNDWILVLDADESVIQFEYESITAFVNNDNNLKRVGRIERISILENDDKRYKDRISRLFNKNYFKYDGTIHEQVVSRDDTAYNTIAVDITVYHVGYTKEALGITNKLKRNKDMLTTALKDNFNDPYLHFQLGKTNYMLKDYISACACFEKALTYKLNYNLEYVEDLIETYGYSLINSGRYSDAIKIKNYLNQYRNSADFHFLLGIIFMNNSKFTEAVDSFLECTKLSNGKMEGITTFLPYYNIGVIFEVLGYSKEAAEYYQMCKDYSPAIERFTNLAR